MPWFKVDDHLATHSKVVAAGNAAMGLWVRAGSWSAQHLTDGAVPRHILPMLGKTAEARRLVDAGLWLATEDGWRFRDWHDYQPSAEDTELAKVAKSEGAQHANHIRWHQDRGIKNPRCTYCKEVSE